MPRYHGFTLWELLCTLAIAAVLLGLGVPSFRTFVLDSRRTADVNGFVLAVQLARSESAKRGRPVAICPSVDRAHCASDKAAFGRGWIVFVNSDDVRPPERSHGEPLLLAYQPALEGSITANRNVFEFRPFRKRSTNGTVIFCDLRGPQAARAVIVSYTGRPRVDVVDPRGRELQCARLP
jgi:type IV fimbrial biogenesis protein FimT